MLILEKVRHYFVLYSLFDSVNPCFLGFFPGNLGNIDNLLEIFEEIHCFEKLINFMSIFSILSAYTLAFKFSKTKAFQAKELKRIEYSAEFMFRNDKEKQRCSTCK